MKLLDLFCGAGGAAMGYYRAGFADITGIDNRPQKHYPFRFIQADALEYLREHGREYDVIHASPPCQGYSRLRHLPWLKGKKYPLLIEPCRNALIQSGKIWIIENVEGAPIGGVILCGRFFGLPIYRHRRFETSFLILQQDHPKHTQIIGHGRGVNDRRKGTLNAGSNKGAWSTQQPIITVAGGQFRKGDGARALEIHWMSKYELSQAIPPAYTEWIGKQLIRILENAAPANHAQARQNTGHTAPGTGLGAAEQAGSRLP